METVLLTPPVELEREDSGDITRFSEQTPLSLWKGVARREGQAVPSLRLRSNQGKKLIALLLAHNRLLKEKQEALPEAYVLVNTEVGSEDEVLEKLKKLESVSEAHCVYGTYDIVAKVGADSMDKLKEITTWKVRKINRVRNTLTMIITK